MGPKAGPAMTESSLGSKQEKAMHKASAVQKILVPVDGSECSTRAIDYLIDYVKRDGEIDVHLLSVQIPIESGHARMFVSDADVQAYHRTEGLAALKEAREMLDRDGIEYTYHILVGHVAQTISRFAEEQKFDRIVMGTHGRTGLTNLLMGSVALDVMRRVDIPLALVK